MNRDFFYAVLATILLLPISASAKPFSDLVIFGGSLADTGNFASVTGDLPPPYYQNRFSNGPVATDVVASAFGFEAKASRHLVGPPVGNNFAMHGALASREGPIDLKAQMDAYFNTRNNSADPDALYLVLIGGNDVFAATFEEPDYAKSEKIIRDTVKGTEAALHRLVGAGAKTIMAANFFDLGIIPAARTAGLSDKASRLSRLFNRLTKAMFNRVDRQLRIKLIRYDFDGLIKTLLRNADELRFTNYTDSCLALIDTGQCDFDHFAFFDEYLPTARVHSLIGDDMTFVILNRGGKR